MRDFETGCAVSSISLASPLVILLVQFVQLFISYLYIVVILGVDKLILCNIVLCII